MNVAMPRTAPLTRNVNADVCVIGAGIAGITTAYMLAREGKSVVVLDDSAIGAGETGRTTAHLSNAIDDRIYAIEERHGETTARLVVESHLAAINRIEEIVRLEHIACQFERLDGYLFVPPDGDQSVLDRELAAAKRAGLSDTTFASRAPIKGIDTGRCLRFPNQGALHPLKYVNALARAFIECGGRIHVGARVLEQFDEGPPLRVHTSAGHTVRADAVVVATNTPVLDPSQVARRQVSMCTYAIAASVPHDSIPRALYWDTADPYHYVRLHSEIPSASDCLIVGGEDRPSEPEPNAEERFDALESWMREYFPMAGHVKRTWSGCVMEPVDGLALIGRYGKGENRFCVTGDSGQGMTHGTIAGILLTDLIMDRANPWQEIYAPLPVPAKDAPPRRVPMFPAHQSAVGRVASTRAPTRPMD